jgi:CelD/BcsL family acetyltransferase involved in cellulose biosynthesis
MAGRRGKVATLTSVYVARQLEELDPFVDAWDRLAQDERRPFGRPDWSLAWWRARQREDAFRGELRVIVICDERGLAAVAPLYVEDVRARVVHLRFIGQMAWWGVDPLVRRVGADETIDDLAAAIASLSPRPSIVSFNAVDVESLWPEALVSRWPAHGAWQRARSPTRATAVRLGGTYEEWLESRTGDWRGGYRRRQRRFSEHGGVVRRAESLLDVRSGLGDLVRLQRARWGSASDRLSPVIVRSLQEAGERLIERGGFRLWTAEVDGRVVGATAFTAAGGAVTALATAFDPQWGRFAPGQRSMVAGIEEGFRLGEDVVDLGFGEYPYKFDLATDVRWVSWYEVFPRDLRYPVARALALPRHTREAISQGRVRLRARSRLAETRHRVLVATARVTAR